MRDNQPIDREARRELVALLHRLIDYVEFTSEARPDEADQLMPLARQLHETMHRLFRNEPAPPLPPELANLDQ